MLNLDPYQMNTDPIHWPVSRYCIYSNGSKNGQELSVGRYLWHMRLCTMERQASAEVGAALAILSFSPTDHMVLSSSKPTSVCRPTPADHLFSLGLPHSKNESTFLLSHTWKTLILSFLPKSSAAVTHYESAIRSRRKRCRKSKNWK